MHLELAATGVRHLGKRPIRLLALLIELVVGIVGPHAAHLARSAKACDVVHMAVRLVRIDAALDPDDLLNTKVLGELLLDLLLGGLRIAVLVEQAHLGGHYGTLAMMEPQGVYFGCTATLARNDNPLGSITLFRERKAGDFTDTELAILLEVAQHASIALGNFYPQGIKLSQTEDANQLNAFITEHNIQPREAEIMRLMLDGKTNKQMANELFIRESTVKKHVNAIYRKLGVSNRLGLMTATQNILR